MIEISRVLLLAAILVASGAMLRRVEAGAAAIWLCGWTAAGTAGILVLVAGAIPETRLHLLCWGRSSRGCSWPEPGGGRLLVVDDDPAVLEVARAFLERSGYDVTTEGGGRSAIARIAEDPRSFDAVVLDVAMPDVSGQDVLRAMRELRPDLPVVLASGYSEEPTAERFAACGGAAFLRKPYEPETLVEKVRRALSDGEATS